MTREELIREIEKNVVNSRLSCGAAHAIARERSVELREIGALCNELKIKITACELGCF